MRGTASVQTALYLTAWGGPDYSVRYGPVFTGQNGPNSYITVQANPTWWLNAAGDPAQSQPSVGLMPANQLPVRWFLAQSNEVVGGGSAAYEELQVPNLQQVIFDDQLENAVPTLQVQLYNINTAAYSGGPLPFGGNSGAPGGPYTQTVLGDPGYLSFQYGNLNQDLALAQNQNYVLWGQTPNEWFNLLREGALLRWYFGYGGLVGGGDSGDLPLTFTEALDSGNVCLCGVFMVDTVQIEAQTGLITLTARCAGGKLLQDQLLYPPLVPSAFYTSSGIEFYPPTPIQYQAYVGYGAPGETAPSNPITTQMSTDGFYKSIIAAIPDPNGEGYLLAGTNGRTFGYSGNIFGYGGITPTGSAIKLTAPIAGIALSGSSSVVTGGSGSGYWLCDQLGNVYGFGSVSGPAGNYKNPSIPNAQLSSKAGYSNTLPSTSLSTTDNSVTNPVVGFAAFPSGNGYWMCTSNGETYAFYQSSTTSATAPPAFGVPSLSSTQSVVSFALTPNGAGCFMLIFDTSDNSTSVYASGVDVNNETLTTHSMTGGATQTFPGAIASTPTGDGYWIAWNEASVAEGTVSYAAYGDAEFWTQKTGSWPATLNAPASAIVVRPQNDGLWIICMDGGVFTFGNADFYGSMPEAYTFWVPSNYVSPYNTDTYVSIGTNPATNQPYTAPNDDPQSPELLAPDYSQIVRILWLWAGGFYPANGTYAISTDDPISGPGWQYSGAYTPGNPASPPSVLGIIFDSGAYDSLGPLDSSTFDKLPILQAMQTIAQAVGYIIRFRYDSGLIFTLPNWFAPGNYLEDYKYQWVSGTGNMITFGDGGYPVYDVTLTSTDAPLRSNIVVSPVDPAIYDNSPAFPNAYPVPEGTSDTVTNLTAPTGTMSLLHGIVKTAMIGVPLNVPIGLGDQNLMAEFQALQCWLAARTMTFESVYDPRVTVDTQVVVAERTTGNTDVQWVSGVHVEHDLDEGSAIATYTSQWMGGSAGYWGVGGEINDVTYDANGNAIATNSFPISDALAAAVQAWKNQNPLLLSQTPLLPTSTPTS